jgi:hypothetical protein
MEVHHVDGNHQNHTREKLMLLHQYCHVQIHSGVHDKHPVVEEPCEVTSLVLQTSRVGDCSAEFNYTPERLVLSSKPAWKTHILPEPRAV